MNYPARYFVSIVSGLLILSTADAQLQPWSINEIYSNADGSVQFIELATAPSPTLLAAGYIFLANGGGSLTNFHNATLRHWSGSGFETLLFATAGYTLLSGAVTPDYTIPPRFLFTPGGTLTVRTVAGDFSSVLSYLNLPTDGIHSLDLNGNITFATPRNFAGQIGVVPEPSATALLFLGLTFLCIWLRYAQREQKSRPTRSG